MTEKKKEVQVIFMDSISELDAAYAAGRRDFTNLGFQFFEFSGRVLQNCDFTNCHFEHCTFNNVRLDSCEFTSAIMHNTSFTNAFLNCCDYKKVELDQVNFYGSILNTCNFKEAVLRSSTRFALTLLTHCEFAKAIMGGIDFENARLAYCRFSQTTLAQAIFACASVFDCSFKECKLNSAYFGRAVVYSCSFEDSDLSGMDLQGSVFRECNFGEGYWMVAGGIRTDSYQFFLTRFNGESAIDPFRVRAGCRKFSLYDAVKHWTRNRNGTLLQEETFKLIFDMIDHAMLQGLISVEEYNKIQTKYAPDLGHILKHRTWGHRGYEGDLRAHFTTCNEQK